MTSAERSSLLLTRTHRSARLLHLACLRKRYKTELCTDARSVSREVSRLPVVDYETGPSGGVQGLRRRTSNLMLVSIIVLDAVSLWLIGVAGLLAESRCVKREVSRPMAADGRVTATAF
ncbi:hypothetical protein OAO87_03890 [bacterium]|nr:hypothetical protein [bacterium]